MAVWLAWGLLLHGMLLVAAAELCRWLAGITVPDDPLLAESFGWIAACRPAAAVLVLPMLVLGAVTLSAAVAVWRRFPGWRWISHLAVLLHLPGLFWCGFQVERALTPWLPAGTGVVLLATTVITTLASVAVGHGAVERCWRGRSGAAPSRP